MSNTLPSSPSQTNSRSLSQLHSATLAGSANGAHSLGTGPRTGGERYRASVDAGGSSSARSWAREERGASSSAYGSSRGPRPSSELLAHSTNSSTANPNFATPETEAIDRWFADLQHYEATLEDMAAASLDANFKEELSAIEQWFRVLSESERTAALYSLLQSSTQVQMRFFVTVLQQMSRADPAAAGLLSPANPGQASMEAQMEAKLAAMNLKSAPSPAAVRQFARQSLGSSSDAYLSPHATNNNSVPSPTSATGSFDDPAAATLASQRAKLKANARISAPANILLGASGGSLAMEGAPKSPMWSERDKLVERRSPSPGAGIGRPKSTGSAGSGHNYANAASQNLSQSSGPPPTSAYLRSPAANADYESQLSPIVGGSWASMVNTPLVPMFSHKNGDDGIGPTDYAPLASPGLDGSTGRSVGWASSTGTGPSGIVLDDVRKFRRSARISGGAGGSFGGGALSGMYDEAAEQQSQQQRRVSSPQHNSSQQNAINLGLAGHQQSNSALQQSQNRNGAASPGLLSAQQSAITAQQNWRNGLGSPNPLTASQNTPDFAQQFGAYGMNPALQNPGNLSANAQLANLFALQQQMMQQQQMQQLGMAAAAAGMSLTPAQLMGLQQQQGMLSPGGRMGASPGMMGAGMSPMGMGMGQSRRSPRSDNRSPGGSKSPALNGSTVPGSGTNPDEAVDMALLADVPAWLRSLRLHKYTPNFEKANWKEMIMLDDAGLDAKGVNALGARRKLLKVFEIVRAQVGMALPGDSTGSAPNSPTLSENEDA